MWPPRAEQATPSPACPAASLKIQLQAAFATLSERLQSNRTARLKQQAAAGEQFLARTVTSQSRHPPSESGLQ